MHFETEDFVVRDLQREELPQLQALFEANPTYFLLVGGQPPLPDEAVQEFEELPPVHMSFGQRWFSGVFDRSGCLQGLLIVLSDLCAPGIWHTALFFLADSQHGTGAAMRLHAGLEAWAGSQGARWLRLGVVVGNVAGERFWSKCGYTEVRTRPMNDASGQTRTVRVLVKPLVPETVAQYLAQVPRDQPGSELP
jgi:GNAT superfamily N-acetyltransferase